MTVEKRAMTGVWVPGARKRSAQVRCETSWVVSKKPLVEAPRAWTTRSGMRSRSNWRWLLVELELELERWRWRGFWRVSVEKRKEKKI
jgi:hypothetical protein